jgi:PilZ domain-containing protein
VDKKTEQYSDDRRKTSRFKVKIPVDILNGVRRCAFGEVVNISRDGAAVDALPPLVIGRLYRFHLRNFGTWPGIVVRRFGARRHGVRFDIDESQKRKIDEDILGV